MLKEKNQNLKLKYILKHVCTFCILNKTRTIKKTYLIKYLKINKIYYSINYINSRLFYQQIESSLEIESIKKEYNKDKQLIAFEKIKSQLQN